MKTACHPLWLAALVLAASVAYGDDTDSAISSFRARTQALAASAAAQAPVVGTPTPVEGAPLKHGRTVPTNSPPVAPQRYASVEAQFPSPATRNQQDVGDCHDFGSIAILEAAYFRRTHAHLLLAEADLFLQKTFRSGQLYSPACPTCAFDESGNSAEDIRFALDNGVLTGDGYASFVVRYDKYRASYANSEQDAQQRYQQEPLWEKWLYDPRKNFLKLEQDKDLQRSIIAFLQGHKADYDSERAAVKQKLAGLTVHTLGPGKLGYDASATALAPRDCDIRGAVAQHFIRQELNAGRPVGVLMQLGGLDAWGQGKQADAPHIFVITGYMAIGDAAAGKETVYYYTRNSWAGSNPDVRDDQMCRIMEVDSVLVPGERPLF